MGKATEKEIERIRKLAGEGMSGGAIGKKLGRTPGSISGICARNNIKLKGRFGGKEAKAHSGRKGGKATSAKRKAKGWVNPATMSKEERQELAEAAKERAEKRSKDVEAQLAKAAAGALHLPLVSFTKHPAAVLPSWGKQKYFGHYYEFTGMRGGQCRFPMTDGPPHAFCGKPCPEDQSYCPEHHGICHDGQVVKLPKAWIPRDAGGD